MRGARLLFAVLAALAVAACARPQQATYVIDPNTGQPVPAVTQQQAAQPQYAQQTYPPPSYQPPAAPSGGRGLFTSRSPQYAAPQGGPYVAAPYGHASPTATIAPPGSRLRVVVFGQDGITGIYPVDAGGNVSLPAVGILPARGYSAQQLSQTIAERLKQGYVREPHVSVEWF